MYRPEGWTGHGELTIEQIKAMAKDEIFEAGADAMLEGLKKDTTKYSLKLASFPESIKGYLVFIPEDTQDADEVKE